MYDKVQADSWVSQLEKELEEARLKWANLTKEPLTLATKVKKVPKLEADVTALQKILSELCGSHQAEIETLRGAQQAEVERLRSLH